MLIKSEAICTAKENSGIGSTPAVILASGLGMRLRSAVSNRPKPMAEINGRPFLEYLVKRLLSSGIEDIIICVSYMKEHIIEYFSKNYKGKVRFSIEKAPLGTGTTLKNAAGLVSGRMFMLYGDSFTPIDYADLLSFHVKNKADITMTLFRGEATHGGRVTLKGKRVVGFMKKGTETGPGLINAGVFVIERRILDRIPDGANSFEKETIPKLLEDKSIVINGYMSELNISIDIGEPDTYKYLQDNPSILEK